MVWTAPRTWIAAEKPSAATMNTHIRDNLLALQDRIQMVRKSADESVTNATTGTTLQNDDELLFTAVAGQTYRFTLGLIIGAAASTIDLKTAFSFPAGTLVFGVNALDPAGTAVVGQGTFEASAGATSGTTFIAVGAISGNVSALITGTFLCTTSGTVRFMWAQNTASASAIAVKAGSYIEAVRLAA